MAFLFYPREKIKGQATTTDWLCLRNFLLNPGTGKKTEWGGSVATTNQTVNNPQEGIIVVPMILLRKFCTLGGNQQPTLYLLNNSLFQISQFHEYMIIKLIIIEWKIRIISTVLINENNIQK